MKRIFLIGDAKIKIFWSLSGRRLQAREAAQCHIREHEFSANDVHLWQNKACHDSCGVDTHNVGSTTWLHPRIHARCLLPLEPQHSQAPRSRRCWQATSSTSPVQAL